ncbi:MAG: thymidylate synthase [Candidatus Paceibacterota bacterium]
MEKSLVAYSNRKTLDEIGYVANRPYSQYETYLAHVYAQGEPKADRTGEGTLSVFGYQMRFNLQEGFPLISTKKVFLKSVILELRWFLKGMHNNNWLKERGVTIWEDWAAPDGDLGPIYGVQWRSWPTPDGKTIDQIAELMETLKKTPESRRLIVSAWNVADLKKMALTPCHAFFQFYVDSRRRLSCQVTQRSCDSFLGVPFNVASYALLTHKVAHQCDLDVGDLVWSGGDCHIYANHMTQVETQLGREPRSYPKLVIKRKPEKIEDYEFEDFEFVGYDPHPAIKAPRAL